MPSVKAKEAIKIGLAFVLVYIVALKSAWMNPYWAALAVVLCALPTAGQSIRKGVARVAGTIPGCLAGFAIVSLAPQSRLAFVLVAGTWIFFTTLMMLRSKDNGYFWNVAGFVAIIIAVAGAGSSEGLFERAAFRTLETGLGIVVYTLVTVFLWPRTNAGAIRKAGGDLVAVQSKLFRATTDTMARRRTEEKLSELHAEEFKQRTAFGQALQAEGSESYEVHELRRDLERFQGLSSSVMESLDRWQTGLTQLGRIDVKAVLPDLPVFSAELDARFEEIQRLLAGHPPGHEPRPVSLRAEKTAIEGSSLFDRAALSLTAKELARLDSLTASMLRCARDLAGEPVDAGAPTSVPTADGRESGWRLPVPDLDHLRGALFVTTAFVAGFLIWVLFDPPGHASWYVLGASLSMAIAGTQQARAIVIVKPAAVALALGLLVYVLVLPQLSTFVGLASVLFSCLFVNNYLFPGMARLPGNIAIVNMISIQNHQTYHFAAMANSYVFTVLVLLFLFALSYLLRSPRPEKAVLSLLRRFFHSAEFLIGNLTFEEKSRPGLFDRWKIDFHRHELETLPAKINAWGRAINPKLFPANTRQQVESLVGSLQALVYRIEELLAAADTPQAETLARTMGDDLRAWRAAVATTFEKWSSSHEAEPAAGLQERLATWLSDLEKRIRAAFRQTELKALGEGDGEDALRLLGGFRGVSDAAVAYAAAAGAIDWEDWRKEVFQ